jgi:hypothetical protein
VRLELASLPIKTKEIKKLVYALEKAGLTVSITNGKHHVKVVNPTNNKVVFLINGLGDLIISTN